MRGCPRAWWFQYAACGEWEANSKGAKTAKNLKALTTPEMAAGSVVDDAIAQCMWQFRRLGTEPQDLVEVAIKRFRRLVETSPQICQNIRNFLPPPDKAAPMHHHFYGYELDEGCLDRCETKIANCIFNFQMSEVWDRIEEVHPSNWMPFKGPYAMGADRWDLDGILVWSQIDFWWKEDEKLFIVDWKSGKQTDTTEQEALQQTAVYALWAVKRKEVHLEDVRTQVAFLQDPVIWNPRKVTQLEFDAIDATIREEHATVMAKLTDGGMDDQGRPIYLAARDDFAVEGVYQRCHRCNYRQMCPEGKAVLGVMKEQDGVGIPLPLTAVVEEQQEIGAA